MKHFHSSSIHRQFQAVYIEKAFEIRFKAFNVFLIQITSVCVVRNRLVGFRLAAETAAVTLVDVAEHRVYCCTYCAGKSM